MQTLMVRNLEPIIKIEHNSKKKKSVDNCLNEKKVIEWKPRLINYNKPRTERIRLKTLIHWL